MNKLMRYYYEAIYRCKKLYWDISHRYSTIDGAVLMYHHISDQRLEELDSCQHTVEQFINSITKFQQCGYRFVSVDEALELIRNKSSQKFAILTFDDVPSSAYELAVPILQKLDLPFVFFITTDYIGKEGYLNLEQILKLDAMSLCTIGAHTVSHPMLRLVQNSLKELADSKKILENILGHSVDYMAYPYGRPSSVSRKVMKLAKGVGYKCAFGTVQSMLTDCSTKNAYYFPRIVCH